MSPAPWPGAAPATRQHPPAPRGPPHPPLGPQLLGCPCRPRGPLVPAVASPRSADANGERPRAPRASASPQPGSPSRSAVRPKPRAHGEVTSVSDGAPKGGAETRSARPSARVPAAPLRRESGARRRRHAPCPPLKAPEDGACVRRVPLELEPGARLGAGLRGRGSDAGKRGGQVSANLAGPAGHSSGAQSLLGSSPHPRLDGFEETPVAS